MLSRLTRILLIASLLVGFAAPSFAWKFVSIADSRGTSNGVNTTELTKIVNRINAEGVDLVLFQGDAIDGNTSDSVVASQFDTFLSVINKLNCPWYFTPGNHEISSSTAQNNVLRPKLNMPTNGPSNDLEMTYSFNHQNAHFVALNAYRYGQAHHVQRDWLAADLAKNTQTHVFVMCHDPGYPVGSHIGGSLDRYPSERDDLWSKMTAGRVTMFFCGHEHYYHRSKKGSIYQIINGSCGAPLYTASGTIKKYHYVLVDVNGNTVTARAKDDLGNVIDSWSYTVPSSSNPAVQLTVSADKTTAKPGETVGYTLSYKNTGLGNATNVLLTFGIPVNTTYVAGSASTGATYDQTKNVVTWTIPTLAPSVTGACTLRVQIK